MILAPVRFLILLLTVSAGPAQAGFHFEGLEPFSTRACIEADQSYTDPIVTPGYTIIEGSPSAFNDGGVPRFDAGACTTRSTGKYGTGVVNHPPLRLPARD